MSRATAVVAYATALLVAGAHAIGAVDEPQVVGATSPKERIETISITRDPGARREVALSIGPARLGTLRGGDLLRASGEVQVTTTCVDRSARCIGRPYRFSPTVGARLVLARGARAVGGERLTRRKAVTCQQHRPHRNHHCVIAFDDATKQVDDKAALPCRPDDCHLNLVVDAHHPAARDGNLVVIGADRPDGSVERGKGRTNAVVVHAGARPDPRRERTQRLHRSIPIGAERSGGNRVIYSVEMEGLARGDVVAADALLRTGIGHLPYNAFISSQLVISDDPRSPRPGGFAKRVVQRPALGEQNGFNCTQGDSAYETPCTTRKAGIAVMRQDSVDAKGQPRPLFVNLVARSIPKLARAHDGDRAQVLRDGHLGVVRYPAAG